MLKDGSLGFMLQGVSQQPARMQTAGNVVSQVNLYPDPNTGLTSRPASDQLFSFTNTGNKKVTLRVGGKLICFSYAVGALAAYDYDGTEYTITPVGAALDYIGNTMSFAVADGVVICANADTVVQTTVPTETGVSEWGFVYALGGEYSKTYSVTVTYADATVATGEYLAPDGDVVGDSAKITAEYIIDKLRTDLIADPNWKGTSTATIGGNVLLIEDTATTFTITSQDGAGGIVVRSGLGEVSTFADVPKYAPHGYIIKVRGEIGELADDVFLKFNSSVTTTVGAGFGKDGTWVEYHDPADALEFVNTTMPHELVLSGTTFTLQPRAWKGRRVGNATNSPTPGFVGGKIADLGTIQSRLWFISGNSFSTTRTRDYTDFFRKTAASLLATDPIDIKPNTEDDENMLYGIAYDRNLIVLADKGQFLIDGTTALTPNTASMTRTTNFEMSSEARPIVAGQTVLLPYRQERYSGINEMFPTDDIATNTIEGMSKIIPRYIDGGVIGMSADANARIALLHTNAAGARNVMYVYNFMWENNTKVQSAWHKWILPDEVVHVYVSTGSIYVWTLKGNLLRLVQMKPDRPLDNGINYQVRYDYKNFATLGADGVLVLDRDDYEFVAVTGSSQYAPGIKVSPIEMYEVELGFRYAFDNDIVGTLIYGVPFETELQPRKPVLVDWRGNEDHNARIVINHYAVEYSDSGTFSAYMKNVFRFGDAEAHILSRDEFPVDDNPLDSFATTIASGVLDVPWGDDQFVSDIVLRSRSHLPVTYIEIRWEGQNYSGRRRYG